MWKHYKIFKYFVWYTFRCPHYKSACCFQVSFLKKLIRHAFFLLRYVRSVFSTYVLSLMQFSLSLFLRALKCLFLIHFLHESVIHIWPFMRVPFTSSLSDSPGVTLSALMYYQEYITISICSSLLYLQLAY